MKFSLESLILNSAPSPDRFARGLVWIPPNFRPAVISGIVDGVRKLILGSEPDTRQEDLSARWLCSITKSVGAVEDLLPETVESPNGWSPHSPRPEDLDAVPGHIKIVWEGGLQINPFAPPSTATEDVFEKLSSIHRATHRPDMRVACVVAAVAWHVREGVVQ